MSPRAWTRLGLLLTLIGILFLVGISVYMGYLTLQAAAANIGDESQGKATVENIACSGMTPGRTICPTATIPTEQPDATDIPGT